MDFVHNTQREGKKQTQRQEKRFRKKKKDTDRRKFTIYFKPSRFMQEKVKLRSVGT